MTEPQKVGCHHRQPGSLLAGSAMNSILLSGLKVNGEAKED